MQKPFSAYLSPTDLARPIRCLMEQTSFAATSMLTTRSRASFDALVRQDVAPALSRYLAYLRSAGLLKPLPEAGGRTCDFLMRWNAMAAGGSLEGVAVPLSRMMLRLCATDICTNAVVNGLSTLPTRAFLKCYSDFVERVEQGRLSPMEADTIQATQIPGDFVYFALDRWQLSLFVMTDHGLQPSHQVPIRTAPTSTMVSQFPFTIRGDKLLMIPWPDMNAFNYGIEPIWSSDLTQAKQRFRFQRHHLRKNGFIPVFCDSQFSLFAQADGILSFGLGGNAPGTEEPAHRLHWPSHILVEPERLRECLTAGGYLGGVGDFLSYLADQDCFPHDISVTPGTHYLYLHRQAERMSEVFCPPATRQAGIAKPYLVLADRPLDRKTGLPLELPILEEEHQAIPDDEQDARPSLVMYA